MLHIQLFVNNPWQENTVLLYDETNEAVLIDSGFYTDAEKAHFEKFISEKGLTLKALLSTHLHIDHVLGNKFIDEKYGLLTNASADDEFLIDNAIEYAAALGLRGVEQPPRIGHYLEDGDEVKFGDTTLKVIAVAGHSPGGLCYYSERDKLLIAGDVLFSGSIGRADLPGGNYKALIEGIKSKLFTLPDDVVVIPGHGPQTTIGKEKKSNPFFN
ncbi:MAG: MBL fold metallo-hydrolase [Marinifilaceae bacterium]